MTYNEEAGYNEVKTVLETYTSKHSELISVTTNKGEMIKSSLGHQYFTNRGWISAENLRAGDILQNVNGEQVVVELVQHELLENPEILYNFAVKDNHNYYVSENLKENISNFVLVHNKCNDTTTRTETPKEQLSDREIQKARQKVSKNIKRQALEDYDKMPIDEFATKYGFDISNADDMQILEFVEKNKRFPSFNRGDGIQCGFAHAIDVSDIKGAFSLQKINKETALDFISNTNNGMLTSHTTHFEIIHKGNWDNLSDINIILESREQIKESVKKILEQIK